MSDNHIDEKHDKLLLGIGIILVAVLLLLLIVFVRCTSIEPEQIQIGTTTTSGEITTSTETTTLTTISSTSTTSTITSSTTEDSTSLETDCEITTIITTVDEVIVITNYPIIVVTDATTVSDEITQKPQTTYTEPVIEETTKQDTTFTSGKLLGTFKGTYFCYERTGVKGGSGRTLIDCSIGENNGEKVIKGSIACRYLYDLYCYNKNGRTTVYIEVPEYPQMTGYYYLDDCNCDYNIVDFFYYHASNCPFQYQGVVSNVSVYIDK